MCAQLLAAGLQPLCSSQVMNDKGQLSGQEEQDATARDRKWRLAAVHALHVSMIRIQHELDHRSSREFMELQQYGEIGNVTGRVACWVKAFEPLEQVEPQDPGHDLNNDSEYEDNRMKRNVSSLGASEKLFIDLLRLRTTRSMR